MRKSVKFEEMSEDEDDDESDTNVDKVGTTFFTDVYWTNTNYLRRRVRKNKQFSWNYGPISDFSRKIFKR